jgi:hypothetical protein
MKLLSALLMTTLMSLAALPEAYADSQPCACQCQCEAAPTTSPDGSVLAIPKPPPPVVVEAVNDELDLQTLGNADATVELTYPEINDGHTAGLYWTSAIGQYRAPVQTVSGGAKKLTFNIPNATVVRDLGQSPVLTASVGVGNDSLVISQPRTIKVISGATPGQYPAATLPDFPDNLVDIGTLADDLKVRVAYDIQGPGQGVKVLWRGATSYDSPMRFPTDNTPLLFTIPHATVIASVGKPVALTYEVALDGQPAQPSDRLAPAIVLRTLKEVPVVPQAVQGQIDVKDLLAKPLRVTYTYSGITAGHTAGIRWAGNPEYDTPHPTIGTTPRPLEFTIPYDKVLHEKDKTVLVSASVGVGDGHLAISPEISLRVIDTRPRGEEVADALNARYTDTTLTCTGNKPAYYCNGVIIRSTQDGNYDPWNPSPAAVRLGGVSFSYMRKDAYVTSLYHASGFTFLPQEQAVANGKTAEYLCIYAYDAGTLVGVRGAQGCGLKPRSATNADASTCASVGVQTVAQWYAYTRTIANRDYQCSLSTANVAQFAASFQVRANRPPNMDALWNEMMVRTWAQNIPASLPLEAFFYVSATGKNEARTYQTKYKARTGGWLPIIKLDLTKMNGTPFSYADTDQAVQP